MMVPKFDPRAVRLRRIPVFSRWLASLLCLGGTALPGAGPRPNDPAITIPLKSLGFETMPPRYLAGGSSMYTLHFVDNTHLLFTFTSKTLLARLPDASPDDDDRSVTALLIELPSGNVLAKTLWRTRDREQYLWPLMRGRFMLRVRNRLNVISPIENLAGGDAFHEEPFLSFTRRIGYVSVSPGGELLTVETAPPRDTDMNAAAAAAMLAAAQARAQAQAQQAQASTPQLRTRGIGGTSSNIGSPSPLPAAKPPAPARIEFTSEDPNRPPIELHFFRLALEETDGQPSRMLAQAAGVLGARNLLHVPVTSEGFLDAAKEAPNVYDFDFLSHAGKRVELSAFESTCSPRPYFVSRSEFIAFGCHGAPDKIALSYFNMRAEQPWIQVFSGQYISPSLATAPEAGRFALSRILVGGTFYDQENLLPEELTAQEIVILQNHDGRTLLKVQASPIQRAGQNFDLSPDGLSFTVVRNGSIEVYHLPKLSPKDQQQVQAAVSTSPEKNLAPIRLKSQAISPALAVSTSQPAVSSVPDPAEAAPEAPEPPRQPPSLYDAEHPKPPKE